MATATPVGTYTVVFVHNGPALRGRYLSDADDRQSITLILANGGDLREVEWDEVVLAVDERSHTREALDAFADGCDVLAAGER